MHYNYQVIQSNNLVNLEWEVNSYLRVGYKLAGGVSAIWAPVSPQSIPPSLLYSQAIIWEGESDNIPDPRPF